VTVPSLSLLLSTILPNNTSILYVVSDGYFLFLLRLPEKKQDKDTGNIVFRNILYNIDELVQQGSASTPFYKKLLTKTIDEAICMTIRNKRMFKDELISTLVGHDITEMMVESRISRLLRIGFIKEAGIKDGRVLLRATKANVLKYRNLDTFSDREHFIDYESLIKEIEKLSYNLGLFERHRRIAKEISDIIGRDPLFISNRIANLAPAIIYTVTRIYDLPVTRKEISVAANVSEPGITKLYHKALTSLKKHFK